MKKLFDFENMIMGAELCDMEINFAQQLLKSQFPKINGMACTLYQEKKTNLTKKQNTYISNLFQHGKEDYTGWSFSKAEGRY